MNLSARYRTLLKEDRAYCSLEVLGILISLIYREEDAHGVKRTIKDIH